MAVIFGTAKVVNGSPVLEGAQGPIALVAANLFVVAFGMSWGPVTWVPLGEIFPNWMRAAALSPAAGGQWIANWIITVAFPGLKDVSLALAYGFYATFALLSSFFVVRYIQETKASSWRTCRPDATRRAEFIDVVKWGSVMFDGDLSRSLGSALMAPAKSWVVTPWGTPKELERGDRRPRGDPSSS